MAPARGLSAVLTATVLAVGSVAPFASSDADASLKSREVLINSGRLSPAERLSAMQALADAYYGAKNYPNAIAWGLQYLGEGGTDPKVRALLSRSYYLSHDFENAARSLQTETRIAEQASRTPSEDALQLLASCYAQLNDSAGQMWALEKLVSYHPKKEYWADLIARTQRRKGFGERLALDVLRLKKVTGTLNGAADYLDTATLALQAGLPAEAKAAIEQGFTNRALGTGSDEERHKRLRDQVIKQAAEDWKTLSAGAAETAAAEAKDGEALVHLGFAYVTHREFAKGIALMEQGLRKGGIDKPQDAKMRLGIAYLLAGQKAKALEILSTVTGVHGAADLGRLWYLYALRSAM